jgi:hypothetical protein
VFLVELQVTFFSNIDPAGRATRDAFASREFKVQGSWFNVLARLKVWSETGVKHPERNRESKRTKLGTDFNLEL